MRRRGKWTSVLLCLSALLFAGQALAAVYAPKVLYMPPSPDSDGNYTVRWYRSATSGVTYHLEEATLSDFSDATEVYAGTSLYTPITGKAGGQYYYRVFATKLAETSGYTVGAGSVQVGLQTAPPGALYVPANNVTGAFTIRWERSATAGATYVVEESLDNFATAPAATYAVAELYKAFSGKANGTYSFRVKAVSTLPESNPTAVASTLVAIPAAAAGTAACNDCHSSTGTTAVATALQGDDWGTSRHANLNNSGPASGSCANCHSPDGEATAGGGGVIGCEGCHGTVAAHDGVAPADYSASKAFNSCVTCHDGHSKTEPADWSAGPHAVVGHSTGTCQRCHGAEGAIAGMSSGWTGSYATLNDAAFKAAAWTPVQPATSTAGVNCAVCHDSHSGTLRAANVYTTDGTLAWDPNGNSLVDQYDLCTNCHTLTDNDGAVVGNYHNGGSINIGRTITDSHFDQSATGLTGSNTVLAGGNIVEGYVIRANSATPCADCHNVHMGDVEVQNAWAKSAHAGKIAEKKEQAVYDYAVAQGLLQEPPVTPEDTGPWGYGGRIITWLEKIEGTAGAIAEATAVGALDDHDGNAWTHYNWEVSSRQSCQRCHTATGAMNFLNDPVNYSAANNDFSHLANYDATNGSAQQELLYCWGCHSDAGTGALRNPGAITEVYSGTPTVTVTYPDVAQSNVCMGCHLGRETGAVIAASTGDFTNLSFINSHYLAAGSTIFNESGYEFAGRDYSDGFHKNVGQGDLFGTGTAGPCVTCHMTSGEAHAFEVLDATGAPATTECAKCHTGLDAAALAAAKAEFHDAMVALEQALAAKGIHFKPSHPYFYQADLTTAFKNWDGVDLDGDTLADNKGKDVMGAAFNYNLFEHDPGAYAHNQNYALKLIADSIDFLADGVIDGSGVFTINSVETNLLGTATDVDPNSDTHVAVVEGTGVLAAIEANTGALTCSSCHSGVKAEWDTSVHANTNTDPYFRGATSSCNACHAAGGEAISYDGDTTTVAGVIGCQACHAETSHTEDAYANSTTACSSCHWRSGHHGMPVAEEDGIPAKVAASVHGDAELTYGNRELCSRCHSVQGAVEFASVIGDADALLASGLSSETGSFPAGVNNVTCAGCHDPHTTGLRAIAGWDPNGNGANDQYDLCTSCHNYELNGMIVGGGATVDVNGNAVAVTTAPYYHNTSWYRTVTSTHYDNPATGYGQTENVIEGYVIRKNGDDPCFDCHGHELRTNTRYAEALDGTSVDKTPTIHNQWALSAHAGGLLENKFAAYEEMHTLEAAGNTYAGYGSVVLDYIMSKGVNDAPIGNAWAHYDWDSASRASCQHCHTATGAANFLDGAAAGTAPVANDFTHLTGNQNELLYCWGCHSSVETGALRLTGAFTVDYTVNGAAKGITAPDGNSAACLTCHSGRGNAEAITGSNTAANPAGAAVSSPGTKSHYLAAGLTINQAQLNAGYTFGLNYADKVYFAHNTLGCADCHMSSADKSHSFNVVEKDETTEAITAITATNCVTCHDGEHALFVADSQLGSTQNIWDGAAAVPTVVTQAHVDAAAAELEHEAHGYHAALAVLADVLTGKGTPPQAGYPYFSGTPADQGHSGAMYNYSYLHHEPGAYAHNRYLAKRLIFDSIDYLDNGLLDSSTVTLLQNGGTVGTATILANADALAWLGTVRP